MDTTPTSSAEDVEIDGTVQLNMAIPANLHREVKAIAARQAMPLREFVISALQNRVDAWEPGPRDS